MRRLHLPLAALAAALLVTAAALPAGAGSALGAVGTPASGAALDGAVPFGDGWAIPLKGARPSWYTDALAAQVEAAAGAPVQAPPDAPLPSEVGIRPGSWMIAPAGCTMNFVFQNGGSYAIGTAGHCVSSSSDRVVLLTLAPGTENPVLVDIGTPIADIGGDDPDVGNDFALIGIRPELNEWVFPTTAVVGGPCGAYTGNGLASVANPFPLGAEAYGPETVWHYGHGLAIGTGGTPRAGVGLVWGPDYYAWDSPSIFGDSGSPVRVTDLSAAGNLTHLVVDTNLVPAFVAGTRIAKMQQAASPYALMSSSLC